LHRQNIRVNKIIGGDKNIRVEKIIGVDKTFVSTKYRVDKILASTKYRRRQNPGVDKNLASTKSWRRRRRISLLLGSAESVAADFSQAWCTDVHIFSFMQATTLRPEAFERRVILPLLLLAALLLQAPLLLVAFLSFYCSFYAAVHSAVAISCFF
jgi:hypothetical protein